MPSRSVPTTPSSGGRGSPTASRPPLEEFEEKPRARERLRILIRRHLDKVKSRRVRSPRAESAKTPAGSGQETDEEDTHRPRRYERLERAVKRQLAKGRAARRKLHELKKKIESRKNRALQRRRDRRARSRGGVASPISEQEGYASDGGTPRGNDPFSPEGLRARSMIGVAPGSLGSKADPALRTPTKGASVGAILSPDGLDTVDRYARERLPSGEMTPLEHESEDDLEEADEEILSESDSDDFDDDIDENGAAPRLVDAQVVQNAIFAALSDVDRSILALTSSLLVLGLLCLDAYATSTVSVDGGFKGAFDDLSLVRVGTILVSVVCVVLQTDGIRRASLTMSSAAVAHATGAFPRTAGAASSSSRGAKSPRPGGAASSSSSRKRANSAEDAAGDAPPLRGLAVPGSTEKRSMSLSKRRNSLADTPTWSIPRVDGPSDGNSWRFADTTKFLLRGGNYLHDKVKVPSARGIYECVAVHVFQSPSGNMPHMLDKHPRFLPEDVAKAPVVGLPRVFAFNISVPTEAPSLRGWRPNNPCWVILIVMQLTDESQKVLEATPEADWPAGLRLAKKWVATAPLDPYFSSRLKGIFFCHPVDGKSLPRPFDKWNGKPVLMAATGGFGGRQGIAKFKSNADYVEVGIDVGESFSYMGRGAVYVMIAKLATLDCDVCFTIEGRADDELPEVVLGASTFAALKLSEKFANLQPPTS